MRIRGRKASADCSVSHLPLSSSSSTSSSSSITAANSSDSSQNSSNSCSFSLISTASPRCHGLDLLVKAIHQVSDGSVVGVPYIQRRVTIRRRRRSHGLEFASFLFDELSERRSERIAKKIHKNGNKDKVKEKKKQTMKKGKNVIGLPIPIRDSIWHSWGRRSELVGEMGL
ncbi:hypothetical protein ACS0TY_003057 [Phlomoides rotata]